MKLTSDINFAAAKFHPSSVSEGAARFAQNAKEAAKRYPPWYEVGAAAYREMSIAGKTAFPPATRLDQARTIFLPSRRQDRQIPCRLVYPATGGGTASGVMLHIHGGGWVLMSHLSSDGLLQEYADASQCAVLSVGYRLAPEHPFPAACEDCIDCAEYLIDRAAAEYGGPWKFMGGESVGSHLSLLTLFHLLRRRPDFSLSGGLLLNFGVYDLSLMPSSITRPEAPILTLESLRAYIEAFTPSVSWQARKSPQYSPMYEDLERFRGRLPAALFTCGTDDPLLDNTVLMSVKWAITGGDMISKYYPGACHGFLAHPIDEARAGVQDIAQWLNGRASRG